MAKTLDEQLRPASMQNIRYGLSRYNVLPYKDEQDKVEWEWRMRCYEASHERIDLADELYETHTMLHVEQILVLKRAINF